MSAKKLKKDKVNQVVDSILAYIIDRKLKIGDKLPSEEDFTHLFGVSRLCVREALGGLKFLGVIETGTRRGSTIKDVDFTLLSRALSFQIAIGDVSNIELLNARIAIELGAVDLLINLASEKALNELDSLIDNSHADDDFDKAQANDFAFHKKLIALANNTILLSFSRILELFFSRSLPSSAEIIQRANDEHRLLVRAIREHNKQLACGLLYSHLARYIQTRKS